MTEVTSNPAVHPAAVTGLPVRAATRPDALTLGAFLVFILIGGAGAVAVRFVVAELAPFWAAAIRFGVAALIFWLVVLVRRVSLPNGRALAGVLLYGAVNFGVTYAFIFWGLKYVPAGPAQVVLSL